MVEPIDLNADPMQTLEMMENLNATGSNPSLTAKILNYINPQLAELFTRFMIAMLILLIGVIIGKFFGKISEKIVKELEVDKFLSKSTGKETHIAKIVGNLISYFIYFIFITIALNELGLVVTLLHIFIIALLVGIIIFLLFSARDLIPNFVAGLFIVKGKKLKVGDKIKLRGITGKVVSVGLIETTIKTKYEDEVVIPNSTFSKEEFIILKRK